MDMIFNTTDFNRLHFVLPRNAAEKWPESFPQLRRDDALTLFRAEYAMKIGTDVGHVRPFSRPFGTYATRNRSRR